MLDPSLQSEILRLSFSEKLSQTKIAKELGINWKSVAAVVKRKSVKMKRGSQSRLSILAPHYPLIDKLLKEAPSRSSANILQHLRNAGYPGGISILRDHVKVMRPTPPKEAFFRIEYSPGDVAQVDWGEFGDVFVDGTKVHGFVMTSMYSGVVYLEFTLSETLPALLRCHERAIRFLGGLHREYWYDNMLTVVAERMGKLVRFSPKFFAYAGFHAFKPVAMNKGKGNEKGGVECGVKYVKGSFWPGRTFKDLDDLNAQGREWMERTANLREHGTKRRIPALVLAEERVRLRPLRPDPYDTDDVISCEVYPDHRIHFGSNTYTVPWTLVGKTVTLRADDREVRIFYGHRKVARHDRCYGTRRDIKNPAHVEGLLEIKPGAEVSVHVEAVRSLGPGARRYLDIVKAGLRSLKREVSELLVLRTVYGPEALEGAIGEALSKGVVGVSNVERILRIKDTPAQNVPPLELDEKLRFPSPAPDLRSYDTLLFEEEEK